MSDNYLLYSSISGIVLTFIVLFGLHMAGFGKRKSFIGAILFGPSVTYIMMTILIIKAGGV